MAEPASDDREDAAGSEPADAAARWVSRHDRGLTAAAAVEFAMWHAASPEHAAEYARISAAFSSVDLARGDAALRALARDLDADTLRAMHRRRAVRARWMWTGGMAAAAALAVLAWVGPQKVFRGEWGATANAVEVIPRASRRVALADGSIAELRDRSEVLPAFNTAERRLRLVRGEAHFAVKKDPARPFIVEAGNLAVRAVGTAFNVRMDASAVEVTVTEGKITLHDRDRASSPTAADPVLVAGQRAVIEATGAGEFAVANVAIDTVTPTEVEQSLAWQGAQLVLNRATLAEAVAAFNQHGTHRLEVGDAALASRRLSGTFGAENADALVRLLEQGTEVRVERRSDGVVVLHTSR